MNLILFLFIVKHFILNRKIVLLKRQLCLNTHVRRTHAHVLWIVYSFIYVILRVHVKTSLLAMDFSMDGQFGSTEIELPFPSLKEACVKKIIRDIEKIVDGIDLRPGAVFLLRYAHQAIYYVTVNCVIVIISFVLFQCAQAEHTIYDISNYLFYQLLMIDCILINNVVCLISNLLFFLTSSCFVIILMFILKGLMDLYECFKFAAWCFKMILGC